MELFRLFFFFGNFLFENVRYFKKKTTDFYSLLKIKIMTSKEFLTKNKALLIQSVGTKINRLEQKNKWNEKNSPGHNSIPLRKEKIKELAIVLEWLENGVFED